MDKDTSIINQIILLLIGGFLPLVGFFVKYWLDKRMLIMESKKHPSQFLYGKQMEFAEKMQKIYPEVTGYIYHAHTRFPVKREDPNYDFKEELMTNSLKKFEDTVFKYELYLPEKIISSAHEFVEECFELFRLLSGDEAITGNPATECMMKFHRYQNTIRELVGIEALSKDFQTVFKEDKEK